MLNINQSEIINSTLLPRFVNKSKNILERDIWASRLDYPSAICRKLQIPTVEK